MRLCPVIHHSSFIMTKSYITILLLALCLSASAQSSVYSGQALRVPFNGVIVDMFGKPLRGVRVYTIDFNYYTTTDRKGRFGLTNVQASDTVHLLYHRTYYHIPVGEKRSMRIVLGDQYQVDATPDVELENLGYGYIDRRESVSSSSAISGEVLRRTGRVFLLDALQGLVPGLHIQGTGGSQKVIIRGINTINSSTDPLYLVDGVEVQSLDFVNIYDIESVEVMKDAFIYGSRGANGAILVTTKK